MCVFLTERLQIIEAPISQSVSMGSDVTFRCEGHDPDGVTTEWFMDDQPLQGKCTIVAELTASLMKKPRGVCFIHIFYRIGFLSIKIREMMRQKYDPLTL